MPAKCRVCSHKKTQDIENDIVQGIAHTTIGKKYGIHFQSVRYHSENHLPEKLVNAVQEKQSNHAENILDGINNLLQRTKSILDSAEDKGHNRLALDAIKEARGTYELLSKIAVKLEEYRRKDEAEEHDMVKEHVQKGLQALSTAELKTYIQLQGKIASADPDFDLDPTARYMVDAMNTVSSPDKPVAKKSPDSDSPSNRPDHNKNSQNTGQSTPSQQDFDDWEDDDFDDFDDFDLELDDFSNSPDTIPSEKTDPKWLKEERKKNGLF